METKSPGIRPIEYNVLIKQDEVEEKTSGGVFIPGQEQDRQKHAQTRGEIVAMSPMAFSFDDWPQGEPKPELGQRVVFGRHAGTFVEGVDGNEYRVVKDKDVVAVMA